MCSTLRAAWSRAFFERPLEIARVRVNPRGERRYRRSAAMRSLSPSTIAACMRKLLTMLNAILKTGQYWIHVSARLDIQYGCYVAGSSWSIPRSMAVTLS